MAYTGTTATITLVGELDVAVVADVRDIVKVVLAHDGLTAVHVDTRRVTFIDSTGLMILMRARRAVEDHFLTFTLTTAHAGPVARVIALCGLDRWLAGCRS
jgi:anti-anti-sigma factor